MKNIQKILRIVLPMFVYLLIASITGLLFEFVFLLHFKAQGIQGVELIISLEKVLSNERIMLLMSIIVGIVVSIVFSIWYNRIINNDGFKLQGGLFKNFKNKVNFKKVFSVEIIFWILILGICIQFGISFILGILEPIFPKLFQEYNEIIQSLGIGNSIYSFIYIVIVAPINEELVFRGVIFNKAKKVMSFVGANCIQALFLASYMVILFKEPMLFLWEL